MSDSVCIVGHGAARQVRRRDLRAERGRRPAVKEDRAFRMLSAHRLGQERTNTSPGTFFLGGERLPTDNVLTTR
jgi:hypothetical protein